MQWTVDQQAVLQSRGCNLLVSAAAGSGKTAVLVERILRLVLEGDNPPGLDQILVVTFTQAAAKEMKERVRKELFTLAEQGVARAHEQLQLVNYAPISTIHAFCLTILRENFHLVGLEPGFRTGDQAECEYMMTEAIDQLMDDCYQEDKVDEDIADLLDCFSGFRNDQGLREIILSIFRFSRTMPWPDSWMKSAIQSMDIPKGTDFGDTIWGKALLQEAHWHIQSMMQLTEKAYLLAESAGFDSYAETFHLDLVLLEELLDKMNKGWDCAIEAAGALSFTRMKTVSKDADTHTKDVLQNMRKKVKDLAENLVNRHLSGSSHDIIQEIRNEKRRLGKLIELVQQLSRIYSRMKRRKNLIDFDDMEHLTLKLLITKTENLQELTDVAKNMQKSWKHIMVDEYQDSSLVQDAILKAIAVETDHFGNLFMVGDVKQSIYRFRQAMPELFLEKYATFPMTEGHKNRKIVLHQNFRSRKPIIHAVNYVFDRLMSRDLGEMNYTDEDALQPGADYLPWEGTEGAPVSFHLIDSLDHSKAENPDDLIASDHDPNKHQMNSAQDVLVSSDENDGSDEFHTQAAAHKRNDSLQGSHLSDENVVNQEELVAIQQEAVWAAHMVDSMVNGSENRKPFTIVEQGVIRPLRYSDCLLLLRTTTGWSSVFTEEFSSMGVPLFSDTGASYFESIEVGIILSLLQIIDNPLQDIPLAAVLRSPVFGWTETQIASVRSADSKQTLYKAITDSDFIQVSEYDRVMTRKKCQDFLDRLRSWRSYAKMVSVRVLLDRLYEESGFLLYTAALPQGERRSGNLKLLAERAARFETTGYKGLFQFLRYVERIRSSKGDMDGAKVLGEGENVVRLMSIHKSKGLEYPVVLLCGTGKKFNLQDQNKKLLLHHKYGLGPDHILPDQGVTWATSAKKAIQSVTLRETISEEMRILYVAMTRAKERLLICGRIPDPDKTIDNMDNYQFDKLPPFIVFSLRNHAQWLAAAWAPLLREGNTIDFRVFQQSEMMHMKKNAIERENQRLTGEFELVADITETNKDRKKTLFSGIPGQVNMFQNGSLGDVDVIFEKNRIEAERRLKWKSRYLELSKIPSKMTVTELKRRWVEEDQYSAQIDRAFQLSDSGTPRYEFISGTTGVLSGNEYQENMDINKKSVETVIAGDHLEIKKIEILASKINDDPDITLQDMVMPKFYSGEHKAKDSFRYGTIMHKILQNIEPDKNHVYNIEAVIENLISDGYLLEEERPIPDRKVLKRYVDSDIFRRMCYSTGIRREMPFTVRMPVHDIIQNIDVVTDETIIVQGVIDCWFVEDKQIVLVDYKTDRSTMRLSAYRRQLHWYAEALHKITGLFVKEKVIWFLHLGLEIRV